MSGPQKTQQNAHPQRSEKAARPERAGAQKMNPQQMLDAPETLRPDDVLAAQQALGNQVVQRALDADTRREDSTDEQGNLLPEISDQINQARGGGSPLPREVQEEARKTLGGNFKDVRLHTGENADQLSRRISARAFTIGKDIFFKKGVYAPGSSQGRETLIHELTHVKQQSGSRSGGGSLKLGERGNAMEQQADRIGKQAAQSLSKGGPQVQRDAVEEEELQMAPEEEEELQMQAEEEEELQMQGEEEELQMQPDVVQRKWVKEGDDWKKVDDKGSSSTPPAPKPRNMLSMVNTALTAQEKLGSESEISAGGKKVAANPWKTKGMTDEEEDQVATSSRKKYEANTELLKKTGGTDEGATDKRSADRMKAIEGDNGPEKQRTKAFSDDMNASYKSEKDGQKKQKAEEKAKFEKTVPGQRIKLMNQLKDPATSQEEIKKIESKLTKLHGMDPEQIKGAKAQRSASLKEAAMRGDEKAYDQMQSEEAAQEKAAKEEKEKNPSKASKFGGFMKKAGIGLAKGIGGVLADQGKDGLKHFLGVDTGKDDDEDEDGEKEDKKKGGKGKASAGGGGGSGEAVGAIMEKYAEVLAENKKLKAQLEKKESA